MSCSTRLILALAQIASLYQIEKAQPELRLSLTIASL
jgi:hypothetical protein